MQLKDHFIVCGLGRVGRSAASEFQRAGASFLVVDRNEQRVAQATEACGRRVSNAHVVLSEPWPPMPTTSL
jgi:Trk K+ transport system NAD-binding subunit